MKAHPQRASAAAANAAVTVQDDGVLAVSGILSFDTVPDVYPESAAWMQKTERAITIDLKDVQHVDSAGLALLVEWMNLAHTKGKTLTFTHVPDQMRSLIQVNKLSQALNVTNRE